MSASTALESVNVGGNPVGSSTWNGLLSAPLNLSAGHKLSDPRRILVKSDPQVGRQTAMNVGAIGESADEISDRQRPIEVTRYDVVIRIDRRGVFNLRYRSDLAGGIPDTREELLPHGHFLRKRRILRTMSNTDQQSRTMPPMASFQNGL
jgi:hypothetical protein